MFCPFVLIWRISTKIVGYRNDLDYHLRSVGFRTKRDCKFSTKVVAVQLTSFLVFTYTNCFSVIRTSLHQKGWQFSCHQLLCLLTLFIIDTYHFPKNYFFSFSGPVVSSPRYSWATLQLAKRLFGVAPPSHHS